jgi:hypothetical protein
MTKSSDESAPTFSQVEVGLVCDDGTSRSGLYGLTDLFTYAGNIAAANHSVGAKPLVRLTQWQAATHNSDIVCVHDSTPGSPCAPPCCLFLGIQLPQPKAFRMTP